MRTIGVALIALFALSSLGWASSGEWEGTAEIEIISDVAGISEESLDIATDASLELSFDGLDIEIIPSFDELTSNVRRVKISDVPKAIEGVKALIDDVTDIKEKSKIDEDLGAEWLIELDAIRTAIEEGRLDEAVGRLRTFRRSVYKAYYEDKPKRLTKKGDASKLRSKAKTAIRNINNIEGLKEDVIDFTCIPFGSASELDCIPVDLATGLKTILDMAKDAVEHHQNATAVGWLLNFIDRVEEGHSEGSIISEEADSLISKAETIIGKIDKGKSKRDLEINISATIAEVELTWELETEGAIFPAPGKDNRDITFNFEADAGLDDLDLTLEMEHQQLDFFERWTKEKGKLVDGLDFKAELDLGDLEITRALDYEGTLFPEGIGKEIEVARVDEAKRAVKRLKQEIEDSPSLLDGIKEELTDSDSKLEKALNALKHNQRDKAVNYLRDFIELVERRRREEKISEDDANWLVTEARGILPRKRIRVSTTTTKAGLDLDDLELGIEHESTIKDLPAETKKDERIESINAELEIERANLSLKGTIEHQRKGFPNDPPKDELVKGWEIETDIELEKMKILGTFSRKATEYPNKIAKNNVIKTRELELGLELGHADCTLSFEREATSYPHDATKDKLVDDRELKLEFEQPEFTIDLERKTTTYPNDPVKDKLVQSAEFQLDWEITTDLQLSLTADFVMTDYPNDPVKDKTSASLKVTIQQEF